MPLSEGLFRVEDGAAMVLGFIEDGRRRESHIDFQRIGESSGVLHKLSARADRWGAGHPTAVQPHPPLAADFGACCPWRRPDIISNGLSPFLSVDAHIHLIDTPAAYQRSVTVTLAMTTGTPAFLPRFVPESNRCPISSELCQVPRRTILTVESGLPAS